MPSRDTEEENCGENKQLESDCLDTVGMLYRCRKNEIYSVQGISYKAPVIVVVKDESNGDPAEPECQGCQGEEPDVAHLKQTTINKTQMNYLTQKCW